MPDRNALSRRETLKDLGVMGAAIALGGPATLHARAQTAGEKPASNLVDVAATRMTKGHS